MSQTLQCITDGIWTSAAPLRFMGLQVNTRMTVCRLSDGGLVLISPVARTEDLAAPESYAKVQRLMDVAFLAQESVYPGGAPGALRLAGRCRDEHVQGPPFLESPGEAGHHLLGVLRTDHDDRGPGAARGEVGNLPLSFFQI